MASFTDTQTPQFNPYVQQLPVEAMVQVGMQKQQQYNTGIEKIQTSIDQISGLDIARDVDKAYVQSKINELGNNLKTFMASDFSDAQLVNSVTGMTGQLAKDPNVQNAVASTAFLRKQQAQMQSDIAAGKENPANTMWFNKRVSSWLNSPDVKEGFSTAYVPPIDVWTKVKDIAKEVGIDEQDVQQLYQTDSSGNILRDSSGNPKWNPIMVEKTLKGKDAGKILKAFQSALTPADYRQLAIQGEYNKSGYTPEMLKQEITNNSKNQIDFADSKIQDLRVALFQEQNKNKKDPARIQSLNDQLDYFQKQHTGLVETRDKNISVVDSNPDAVRASLYTNDYLHDMSKTLASQDSSTKYSVNPLFTVTMEQNKFNRDLQRDKIADYHWSVEQRREDRKLDMSEKKDAAQIAKDNAEMWFKYGVGTPPPGTVGPAQLPEGIPTDKLETLKAQVEDDYSTGVAKLNDVNYDITLQYFKSINSQKPGESPEEYEARMRRGIYSYAKNNKESVDANSGDINSFTARFASKQMIDWKKNPNNVPAEFRTLMGQQDNMTSDLIIQKNKIQGIRKEALRMAKEQGISVPTPEEIKKNVKETTITVHDRDNMNNQIGPDKQVNLSKQDVVDFATMYPQAFNTFGTWTVDNEQTKNKELAEKRLKLKFGNNFDKLNKEIVSVYSSELGDKTMIKSEAIKNAGEFMHDSNYKALAKLEGELYIKKGVIKQPTSVAVMRGDENKEDVASRVSAVVDKYNVNETPGFSREDVQAAVLSKDPSAVKLVSYPGVGKYSDTKYEMRVTNPKNGQMLPLTIDKADYEYIQRQSPPVSQDIPKTLSLLNDQGTTNHSKGNSPDSAHFGMNNFKNLTSTDYTVTGDLINDKADPGKAWFKLYIHHKNGSTETVTYPQPIEKFNADGSPNTTLDYLPLGINSSVIQQITK